MPHPLAFVDGVAEEAKALGRTALAYLTGVSDPHDEDIVEMVRCEPDAPVCHLTPVFLVHGFLHNWSGWLPLMSTLADAGYVRFVRFNYDSAFDSPEEIAGRFARVVTEVRRRLDVDRVHVVGHSLGGVVARSYVAFNEGGADLVAAGVSLGGPLQGTPWGRLPVPLPTALDEVRPGSELIALLNGTDDDRSRWTTVAGSADILVPPSAARLPGAAEHVIPGLGHIGLLYDDGVHAIVRDALLAREDPPLPVR